MLVLVHAPHADVVAALRGAAEPEGVVGPTSSRGWTPAWVDGLDLLVSVADLVVVDEEPPARISLAVWSAGTRTGWAGHVGDEPAPHLVTVAQVACAVLGRAEASAPLAATISSAETPDEVAQACAALAGIPRLEGPEVVTSLVLVRTGDPSATRIGGRLAARQVGTVRSALLDDDWLAAQPTDLPGADDVVATAVAAATGRGAAALTLWRSTGSGCGLTLWQDGQSTIGASWGTGWRDLWEERLKVRDTAAAVIAERLGTPGVDRARLRALLRARSWSTDPLAEVVEILGLPTAALAILDARAGAPALVELPPAGPARAWWDAVRRHEPGAEAADVAGRPEPWVRPRWAQVTLGVVAIAAALVLLVLAGLAWAVVLTDGRAVEQAGVTGGDWAFVVAATLGAALNAWCARQLLRFGRFF